MSQHYLGAVGTCEWTVNQVMTVSSTSEGEGEREMGNAAFQTLANL